MIQADLIRSYLEDELTRKGIFLVDVVVRPGNKIAVYIDSMKGVTLDECMTASKFLESKLDRDIEDFELEVSSPGLDRSLKLPVQYMKNTGRMIDIVKVDGNKITGKLGHVYPEGVQVETEIVFKDVNSGKRKKEQKMQEIKFDEIKTAKIVISLKK
jgi:ribosome maturation factor RimP